jgi:hypothetical protein
MSFPNGKYSLVVDGYLGFLTVNVDSAGNVSGVIQTSATPLNITGTWNDAQKKLTFSPPSISFFSRTTYTGYLLAGSQPMFLDPNAGVPGPIPSQNWWLLAGSRYRNFFVSIWGTTSASGWIARKAV